MPNIEIVSNMQVNLLDMYKYIKNVAPVYLNQNLIIFASVYYAPVYLKVVPVYYAPVY